MAVGAPVAATEMLAAGTVAVDEMRRSHDRAEGCCRRRRDGDARRTVLSASAIMGEDHQVPGDEFRL